MSLPGHCHRCAPVQVERLPPTVTIWCPSAPGRGRRSRRRARRLRWGRASCRRCCLSASSAFGAFGGRRGRRPSSTISAHACAAAIDRRVRRRAGRARRGRRAAPRPRAITARDFGTFDGLWGTRDLCARRRRRAAVGDRLPLSLAVGAWLLRDRPDRACPVGRRGRRARPTATSAPRSAVAGALAGTGRAHRHGRRLRLSWREIAGLRRSARRAVRRSGHEGVGRGDPGGAAGHRCHVAAELLVAGGRPWQVLAGAVVAIRRRTVAPGRSRTTRRRTVFSTPSRRGCRLAVDDRAQRAVSGRRSCQSGDRRPDRGRQVGAVPRAGRASRRRDRQRRLDAALSGHGHRHGEADDGRAPRRTASPARHLGRHANRPASPTYQSLARAAIDDIRARGRVPILVGGSGLYVRAVLEHFEFPGTDPELRARLEAELADGWPRPRCTRGWPRWTRPRPRRSCPSNGRRIVRALEVIELTGGPFTAALPDTDPGLSGRADRRRHETGELDDADRRPRRAHVGRRAGRRGPGTGSHGLRDGLTAPRALGYQQVLAYLDGELYPAQAAADTVQATRRFVRRQRKWFRRDPRIALARRRPTPDPGRAAEALPWSRARPIGENGGHEIREGARHRQRLRRAARSRR